MDQILVQVGDVLGISSTSNHVTCLKQSALSLDQGGSRVHSVSLSSDDMAIADDIYTTYSMVDSYIPSIKATLTVSK